MKPKAVLILFRSISMSCVLPMHYSLPFDAVDSQRLTGYFNVAP